MHAISASGTGLWEVPSGTAFYDTADGNIDNSQQNNPNAWIRYAGNNDSITFYWREYNGICVARDSVTVYFAAPVSAISYHDPADSTNCGLTMIGLLDAEAPTYGIGHWIDTVFNTTFIQNTNHVDTTIVSYYGMHHFYWIVENGACIDTSEVAAIRFIEIPNADVGEFPRDEYGVKKDTACGYEYALNAAQTVGIGMWYTTDSTNTYFLSTGTGHGVNNNDTIHTNILNYNDNPPYRDVYWVVDNDGCVAKDTIRILFAPVPTGNFHVTVPYCIGYDSYITADVYTGPNDHPDYGVVNFDWDFNGGIVDSMNMNTLDSSWYVEVHWTWNGDTMHIVDLVTENIFGCRSSIHRDTVHEPPMMVPDYDLYNATCGYPNGVIALYTNNHQYTFLWDTATYNGYVNPLNDSVQVNLPGNQEYMVYVIGESQSPDAASVVPRPMCTDTLRIWMSDTGHTIAMFDTSVISNGERIAEFDVDFHNQSENGLYYEWYIYDEHNNIIYTSEDVNPSYTFRDEGYYTVVLISISPEGCRDTLKYGPFYVESESFVEVPNVFTPNGDGVADYFQVHAKTLDSFHGVILDRWGRKLYEWDDWQNETSGWDGKVGNSLASPGVYYYVITAHGRDRAPDDMYEFKGSFYLLRGKE
jgi:gliding motility-associated-like protein